MLYRVHRPHNQQTGQLGSQIGYIQLCHGYTGTVHVYTTLVEAKLIEANDALNITPVPSPVYGVNAFDITRVNRRVRETVLYLHPIEAYMPKPASKSWDNALASSINVAVNTGFQWSAMTAPTYTFTLNGDVMGGYAQQNPPQGFAIPEQPQAPPPAIPAQPPQPIPAIQVNVAIPAPEPQPAPDNANNILGRVSDGLRPFIDRLYRR